MMVDIKRDVNHMGSDLGYKHNGNMCGNPNRLGHRSVTYSAQASDLGTGPVCPAPMRSSLVAERWLDVQSGLATLLLRLDAVRCTLCVVRRPPYNSKTFWNVSKRFRTLVNV